MLFAAGALLDCLPGTKAGRPGPLEVESAEVAGYVHDFANEIKPGHFVAFHGPGREFVCVDAAGGDFGFVVTLGAFRDDFPMMGTALQFRQRMIGPALWRIE